MILSSRQLPGGVLQKIVAERIIRAERSRNLCRASLACVRMTEFYVVQYLARR